MHMIGPMGMKDTQTKTFEEAMLTAKESEGEITMDEILSIQPLIMLKMMERFIMSGSLIQPPSLTKY